mgnify:CR=1 FL=1
MDFVTVVNRTSKLLHGVYDGKHIDLAPGKHAFPLAAAEKYKNQNPIMGTEDPYSGERQYLIGIEEMGDDCTPVEQSTASMMIDLAKLPQDPRVQYVVVKPVQGMYRPSPVDASPQPLMKGDGFVTAVV